MKKLIPTIRTVPRAIYLAAFMALVVALISNPAIAEDSWTTGWPAGQPSNAVTALQPSPTDGASAYAATAAGLYRTTSGGGTWHVVSGAITNISLLAISHASPRIIYAHATGSDGLGKPILFRSDDGGATWRDPGAGGNSDMLSGMTALLAAKESPETLLAGVGKVGDSYGRILKTTDGGATWRQTYAVQTMFGVGQIAALVEAPSDGDILYAGHSVYHGGALLRSSDGGESWSTLPLPPETALTYPAALAVAADDPQRLSAAFQGPAGGGVLLFFTKDGGQSWSKTGLGVPGAGASMPRLRADAADPRRVFMAVSGTAAGVYASYDRGQTWTVAGQNSPALGTVFDLAVSASGQTLYSATGNGVWQLAVPSAPAWRLDPRFTDYYATHDGLRVLGRPISGSSNAGGFYSQYFEKGRIEDHASETSDPNWRFMYGLLVDELQQKAAARPVGGDSSTISYVDIGRLAAPSFRVPVPSGLESGTARNADGSVFVPFSTDLRPAAGHNVTARFWQYINRADLFPGGWLHDIGLPITEPLAAVVDKGAVKGRSITVQAFQRTVLTDDPLNPSEWQIERANAGTDYY